MSVHDCCHQVVNGLSLLRILRVRRNPLQQVVQECYLVGHGQCDVLMERDDHRRENY